MSEPGRHEMSEAGWRRIGPGRWAPRLTQVARWENNVNSEQQDSVTQQDLGQTEEDEPLPVGVSPPCPCMTSRDLAGVPGNGWRRGG